MSADPYADNGMVNGGGGGGRANLRMSARASATTDTGVSSGSRSVSSAKALQKEFSLISYGPTQTTAPHLGYLHTGMTPIHVHVSSSFSRSTLGGLNHGGLAAPGGWGGSSGSKRSAPLYSTMMKVERYGMTRQPTMGPTKPGKKKGSGSAVDKLLGQSSGH
ncbi:hypothetical protein [Granulicella sp. S156]|uniref:hypothetical protein n=1 Tax=Granulicella sp. S156 TaxID=1747224 RepID=UPI00131DDBE9|nr:hypothetical protein [Granulicella sp. S156]